MPPKVIRIITVRQMDRLARVFSNKSDFKRTIMARYRRDVLTHAEVEYLFGKYELRAA